MPTFHSPLIWVGGGKVSVVLLVKSAVRKRAHPKAGGKKPRGKRQSAGKKTTRALRCKLGEINFLYYTKRSDRIRLQKGRDREI